MDICEKKNQIQNILNDIFTEYNRMNETKIQSNCENNLEMRNMIDTIRSLENTSNEKDNKIQSLEKTNHEYSTMINELQSKLELEKEETQEENKFKTTIIQANEIHKKDMEIERLNNVIKGLREKLNTDKKIDTILNKIDTTTDIKVEEHELKVNLTIEPEPINVTPEQAIQELAVQQKRASHEEPEPSLEYPLPPIEKGLESEPSPNGSISSNEKNENIENDENEVNKLEQDKGKIITLKYRNVKYLAYENENPQQVYEFNTDKKTENIVGKRTRNEKTGRYKILLN